MEPCFSPFADALVEMVDGDGRSMGTQYYNPGSEIELACVVRNRSLWSTDVLWLKDGQPLDIYNKASIRYRQRQHVEWMNLLQFCLRSKVHFTVQYFGRLVFKTPKTLST